MTYLPKLSLAVVIALGAAPAFASNGDMLQIRDQLRDSPCVAQAEALLEDQALTMDQARDRLRDGSCLLEDEETEMVPTQTRTRAGEDKGAGNVLRHRNEGGTKTRSGRTH